MAFLRCRFGSGSNLKATWRSGRKTLGRLRPENHRGCWRSWRAPRMCQLLVETPEVQRKSPTRGLPRMCWASQEALKLSENDHVYKSGHKWHIQPETDLHVENMDKVWYFRVVQRYLGHDVSAKVYMRPKKLLLTGSIKEKRSKFASKHRW